MKRVMIVDDSLTVRMDLDRCFVDAGYETVLCKSAQEARKAMQASPPDLVVLDVVLPDADGVELLHEWRQSAANGHLPIIMLSSEAEIADRLRGLTSGADEYVGKPYDTQSLLACAARLLARATVEVQAASPLVLVIDDSTTVRQRLKDTLIEHGYRVALAKNGEEGLLEAKRLRPDVIIVDSVMPGIDGTTLIRRIRLDAALHQTPCLLLTASQKRSYELKALDSGADAYLHKSDGQEVLLARLTAMLRSRGVGPVLRIAPREAPQTVLAVDDSATYREVLSETLGAEGYQIITASSGEEALNVVSEREVDCILLDVVMPGVSGIEVCRQIKRGAKWRSIPIIMLTGREEHEAMIEGIDAGADDYVTKSADFDLLKARLRAQLRRKHFEDENRRIRDELLRMDLEARAARDVAGAKEALLREVERKNVELAQTNRQLQGAKKLAEEESDFKSKFLANMSHELRTPLNAIIGFSDLLAQEIVGPLGSVQKEYVENVRASGKHLLDLINDVLDLSKIAAGKMELAREWINLGVIADAVSGVLEPLAEQDGIEVSFEFEDDLPDLHVDPVRLRQVLYNLLSNAVKFTPRGGRVRVAAYRAGGAVKLSVEDTGIGISEEDRGRLFREFEQLEPGKRQTAREGTGLGLALSRSIVEMHGGSIGVESEPGVGSVFTVRLPLTTHDHADMEGT